MSTQMHKIINDIASQKHATDAGTHMHDLLRQIKIDGAVQSGDDDIVSRLLCLPELLPLFSSAAKTEVPVAGIVRGKFVSRRFDRMLIDGAGRCVYILDYKTDTDKTKFIEKYKDEITNPNVVFNTIQYSRNDKKVYFYTDKINNNTNPINQNNIKYI